MSILFRSHPRLQGRRLRRRSANALESLEVRRLLANIVVNTAVDEFDANTTTSLREAVVQAAGTGGDDVITFDPTAFPIIGFTTITPQGEPIIIPAGSGRTTITGIGTNHLAISGADSGRGLDVSPGADVVVTGITFMNGGGGVDFGGAIYNQGTLRLDDVLVISNKITVPAGTSGGADGGDSNDTEGAGIYNVGTLTIEDSRISSNQIVGGAGGTGTASGGNSGTLRGSGIFSSGALTVRRSVIENNFLNGGTAGAAGPGGVAGNGGAVLGAGIFSDGTLVVEDTEFRGNEAFGGNGAAGNAANGGDGGVTAGAGLYATGTSLAVTGSTFSDNRANAGSGGGSNLPTGTGGAAGAGRGGGIAAGTTATTIADTDFVDNFASGGNGGTNSGNTTGNSGPGGGGFGGAIASQFELAITGGDFTGNQVRGLAGDDFLGGVALGGAIYSHSAMTLTGPAKIVGNTATGGSGIAGNAFGGGIAAEADLTITDAVITGNSAIAATKNRIGIDGAGDAFGGGIYVGTALKVRFSTIADNTARGGDGPNGFFITGGNGEIGYDGGHAFGGGIYVAGGNGDARIDESTVSGNDVIGGKGGIGANGSSLGSGGDGGDGGEASGAGIYVKQGTASVRNSTVYGNAAVAGAAGTGGNSGNTTGAGGGGDGGAGGNSLGGGIGGTATADLRAINATIAENSVASGAGAAGGAAGTGGGPAGTAGANGLTKGGGIHAPSTLSEAFVANTIVADNAVSAGGGGDLSGTFRLFHALVSTPPGGDYVVAPFSDGNLLDTPALLGPLQDNGGPTQTARPAGNSLAIDAGSDEVALDALPDPTNDQRGPGFARIAGAAVDIGAVEKQGPAIVVRGNGNAIANGDTTPSATDFTNFGSTAQGAAAAPQRVYVIANQGEANLVISAVHLPSGYSLVGGLPAPIAPGATGSITVRLSTAAAGTFAGNVVIDNNDVTPAADATFKFRVTGTITPVASTPPVKINFQPSGRPIPAGYLADVGLVFGSRGNGFSYGWNQSITNGTRDRELIADQKLDTFVHTQLFGTRTWEIAVPNGTYLVKLAAGDPLHINSVYKFNVEGVLTVSGTPTSGTRFFTGTKVVTVADGKLTVSNAAGAVNNKLDYIEIKPVTPPVKINFQPAGRPVPAGYLADTGAVFGNRGNGFSYGWNSSAASFTRDRELLSDQKFDTFVHTQLYGVRTWDLNVVNGTYQVKITAGDPFKFDSVYKFNVEGLLTVNGTPTSGNRFITATRTVTVTDGKLTISNASGSVNNKLAFMEITPV